MLELDELVGGADSVIERLEARGWAIIFLSSRPENLRRATKDWLKKHQLLYASADAGSGERSLILKPPKSRFVSTPKWKAEVICAAGVGAEQVLLVDDESENLSAVKGLWRTKALDRSVLKTCKALELIEWD